MFKLDKKVKCPYCGFQTAIRVVDSDSSVDYEDIVKCEFCERLFNVYVTSEIIRNYKIETNITETTPDCRICEFASLDEMSTDGSHCDTQDAFIRSRGPDKPFAMFLNDKLQSSVHCKKFKEKIGEKNATNR